MRSGFVLAQPAAAATRSYQSLPTSGIQQPLDRTAAAIGEADELHGAGSALIIILVFGGLLAALAGGGAFGSGKDSTG